MPTGYVGQQSLCTIEELIGSVQDLSNSNTLLDIGCGKGAFPIYISEKVPSLRILSIDSDHIAIAASISAASAKGLTECIKFMTVDMDEWYSPTQYDVIFSADVLQHSRTPIKLLNRLRTLWSTRGPFGISTWWFGNNQDGRALAHRWGCENAVSLEEYCKYCSHNGWSAALVDNTPVFQTRLEGSLESLLEVEVAFRCLYGNQEFEHRLSLENDTVRATRSGIIGQVYILAGANKAIELTVKSAACATTFPAAHCSRYTHISRLR